MLINFWDRAALGLAAVPIMRDLRLSNAQFGLLGSSFFALFSLSAFVFGRLSDRWSLKWLVATMALTWALAQAIMVGARRFPIALAGRILLGAGEGPAFPTALHTAYSWFPSARRAWITGIIAIGGPLGVATGAPAIAWVIGRAGWHGAFALLGGISFLWCVVWILLSGPDETTRPAAGETRGPARIGYAVVAAFAVYWISALTGDWFPAALQVATGMSLAAAGTAAGLAWALQIPVYLLTPALSTILRNRSRSVTLALGAPAALGILLSGAAAIGMGIAIQTKAAPVLMTLCIVSQAIAITCLPPIVGEAAMRGRRGTAMGTFIAISSLGGLSAPFVFGRIVDAAGAGAGGYRTALVASGIIVALAAPFALVVRRGTDASQFIEAPQ